MKNTFSGKDILVRIGGDEFSILSIDVSEEDAKNIMNKFLEKQREFNEKNQYPFNISISVGATYFDPENPKDIDELISKADRLMYENKKNKEKPATM